MFSQCLLTQSQKLPIPGYLLSQVLARAEIRSTTEKLYNIRQVYQLRSCVIVLPVAYCILVDLKNLGNVLLKKTLIRSSFSDMVATCN